MQPRHGSFDNPAIDTQAAAMFGVAAGNLRLDASCPQVVAARDRIIGSVAVEFLGALARMSDPTGNRRDFIHDVKGFLDVGYVGTGDGDGQGDALAICDEVVLGPQLTAIGRVFAGFLTSSQGTHMAAVDNGSRPVNAVGLLKFGQEELMQAFPDPRLVPGSEIVPAGHARAAAHLLRQQLPRDAALKHENDPGEGFPRIQGLAPWEAETSWFWRRQQGFDLCPQGVAD